MTTTDTNALHERKEELYRELQDNGKQIATLINELKERREKRNALTQLAQEAKQTRKDLSKIIKDKIGTVKEMRSKLPPRSAAPAPVHSGRGGYGGRDGRDERMSPGKLREEIARIELRLETSAMDFTDEQKLTKILKEKKAQLAKIGGESDLERDVRARSKEIDKLKKDSDVAHEAVTKAAKESQEHHEAILSLSKQIEDLKTKEVTVRDEYAKIKEQLSASGEALPEKKPRKQKSQSVGPAQPSAEDKVVLKEKAAEVEQKVKDKKKLTTEDLLAFQAHK